MWWCRTHQCYCKHRGCFIGFWDNEAHYKPDCKITLRFE